MQAISENLKDETFQSGTDAGVMLAMPVMGRHRIEFVPSGSESGESACGPAIVSSHVVFLLLRIALSGGVMLALTLRCLAACCGTLEGHTGGWRAGTVLRDFVIPLSVHSPAYRCAAGFVFWGAGSSFFLTLSSPPLLFSCPS